MYVMNITDPSSWRTIIEKEGLEAFIMELLGEYESLGPIPGFVLTFIESFLPFLPLIAFVIANAAAYGLLKGFLVSWSATSIGSIIVFLIFRKLRNKRWVRKISENKQVKKVTVWVENHGFGPLFLLLCFPFSPSSIINIVAALSNISVHQFILAVLLGKTVMVFSIAYIGSSIMEFAQNPFRTIIVGVCIILFWIIGKYFEKLLQKKSMPDENP